MHRYTITFLIGLSVMSYGQSAGGYANLILEGDSLLLELDYKTALKKYKEAEVQAPDEYIADQVVYKIGYLYVVSGQKEKALAVFKELIDHFIPVKRQDSAFKTLCRAELDHLLEKVVSPAYQIGNLISASETYFPYLTNWQNSRLNYLIANIYYKRRYFEEALRFFNLSLSYQHKDMWLIENTWFRILVLENRNYENQRVADIATFILSNGAKYTNRGLLNMYLGYPSYKNGLYTSAIPHFKKGLACSIEEKDTSTIVHTCLLLANCYLLTNEEANAKVMYDSTESLAFQFKNPSHIMGGLVGKAYFLNSVKNEKEALEYFKKASKEISKFQKEGLFYRTVLMQYQVEFYEDRGEYQVALDSLGSLFNDLDKLPNSELMGEVEWKYYETLINKRADLMYKLWLNDTTDLNRLRQAFSLSLDHMHFLDEAFQRYLSYDARFDYLSLSRKSCERAFRRGYELYGISQEKELLEKLLTVVEQSKSTIFRANFLHNHSLSLSGIPEKLVLLEKELKRQEAWLRHCIEDIKGKGQKELETQVHNDLVKVITRQDSIMNVLEDNYPNYYSSKYKRAEISIADLQASLGGKQAILDYFLLEDKLYIQYLTQNEAGIKEVLIDSNIYFSLRLYRNWIENPSDNVIEDEFYRISYYLYSKLIKPICKIASGKSLFIIPDQEINLVPFESLVVSSPDSNCISIKDYLVFHNPVNVLYSLEQFHFKPGHINSGSRFLGFAPGHSEVPDSGKLNNLPGAVNELLYASEYFMGEAFTGTNATKESFFQYADGADIIHLALHTNISNTKPLYSELWFADSVGRIDTLFIYEVLSQKLKSKIVVLSGCNTANGELKYGEGVVNLARSFIYSGVDNLLVTQWAVADQSSSRLMKFFYENLTNGSSADIALQQAKIDFLQTADPLQQHPYYWSGYISVGSPVIYETNLKAALIFSITVFFLSVFVVVVLLRRRTVIGSIR